MTENENQNIELSIEPALAENVTQLENIEQEETTDTPENVNNTQEDQLKMVLQLRIIQEQKV